MRTQLFHRAAGLLVVLGSITLSCSSTDSTPGRNDNGPGTSRGGTDTNGNHGTAGTTAASGSGGASVVSGAGGADSGANSSLGEIAGAGHAGTAGMPGTADGAGGSAPESGGTTKAGGTAGAGATTKAGGSAGAGATTKAGGSAAGGQVSTGGEAGTGGQSGSGGPSPGCGKAGAVIGAKTGQTITVAGAARTYVLSVPTGYTGNTPLALVFVWHGANLSGSLGRQLFNLESKSNGAAIFVYPDGLPMSSSSMTGWDLSTGSADFQFFEDLLSFISSNYCVDSNRIFSTGHSMGAMMTNILGCSYGDVFRAIAPASGTPPSGGRASCTGKVAAWIAHGENDPTVNFSQGEASRDFWIAQNGCTTQTAAWAPEPACVEYQGCQPDLPVVWCVHDEGHSWPSLSFGCDGGICFDGGSGDLGVFLELSLGPNGNLWEQSVSAIFHESPSIRHRQCLCIR